jgi:xanthine dehydrogenase molybdenum-binding subunit
MSSTTPADFKVLGTRPIRHDGFDKVTGKARYGADYNFAEMLYGKVLRSPHAHANIKSIHVDKALRLPGVKAVITGADFPTLENKSEPYGEYEYNPSYMARNIMAREKALYDGHAVAAVAAIDPHIAQEALELIEVEYEPLPAVLDVRKAMEPDAPILLPDLSNPEMPGKPTNVASHMQFARGNLQAGFAAADFVVEREFTTAMVHQGYVEPHNAVAVYHTDGCATVYSSSQSPVDIRTMSARVSGVPVDKVVPAEIGGGFGGKLSPILEPVAVLLSQRTGHAVKMVMSRNEEFRATGPTSGTYIKVKMGATREGKLTAVEIWMAFEAGALPGSPVGGGMICAITSYAIENFQLDGYDVVVNRPKTGAYRAPGATMAAFAVESVVDELARKCETDPLEFRIRNGVKEGSVQVIGIPFKRIGFIEVCEAIKNSDHYRTPLAGPNRGRGVAVGFWINGGMSSSAAVNIHSNGTVSVVTGSVDIGGTRAVSAMIAAEVLGVPAEEVRPMVADTDSIAHTDMTGGSRTAFATGWAVLLASQDALAELKRRAAKLLQIDPAEVAFEGGKFFAINNGKAPLTLRELAAKFPHTGGPVSGKVAQRHPRRRTHLRRLLRRCRGRPGYRQSPDPALHGGAGRW